MSTPAPIGKCRVWVRGYVKNEQDYKGSLADKAVKERKLGDQPDQRPTIY